MLEFGDERLPGRFWDKVSPEPNSGCWLWSGSIAPGGYGQFWLGRLRRCNRLVIEVERGPLSEDQHACHKCDNPNCCNPAHLFVGTVSSNMRDKVAKGRNPASWKKAPVCKRGHVRIGGTLPRGQCRECRKLRQRVEYLNKEAV